MPTEHCRLALHGLSSLLRQPSGPANHDIARQTEVCDMILGPSAWNSDNGHPETTHNVVQPGGDSGSACDSAVYVLPVIDDWLGRYLDMLDAMLETSADLTTPPTLSSSDSTESSDTSLTSTLAAILRSSASMANDVECFTSAALRALLVLVDSSAVRDALLLPPLAEPDTSHRQVDT